MCQDSYCLLDCKLYVLTLVFASVSPPHYNTVEPLNKGHIGTRSFVLYREVSFIRRVKCTGIIGIGTSRFVLYREVFFIRSVLYRRFHCTVESRYKEHA